MLQIMGPLSQSARSFYYLVDYNWGENGTWKYQKTDNLLALTIPLPDGSSSPIEQLKVEAGTLRVYVGGSQPSDLAKAAGQTAQQSNGIWASVDITAASMLHMCSPPPQAAA